MSDKERIEYIIRETNLTNVEFSARTGIAPATLSHITSGRSKPTLTIMKSVLEGFPQFSPEWVFLGSGPVYKTEAGADGSSQPQSDSVSHADASIEMFAGVEAMASHQQQKAYVPEVNISEVVAQTVSAMRKPQRQIVEVRIFFDDGTYDVFDTKSR